MKGELALLYSPPPPLTFAAFYKDKVLPRTILGASFPLKRRHGITTPGHHDHDVILVQIIKGKDRHAHFNYSIHQLVCNRLLDPRECKVHEFISPETPKIHASPALIGTTSQWDSENGCAGKIEIGAKECNQPLNTLPLSYPDVF